MQSHIHKVYACLVVACQLHFWQNDRDLLCPTAVTRGWNGYWNKSQHRKLTLEKKILPPLQQGFEPAPFNHESGALTTELSPLKPKILHMRPQCSTQNSAFMIITWKTATLWPAVHGDWGLQLCEHHPHPRRVPRGTQACVAFWQTKYTVM